MVSFIDMKAAAELVQDEDRVFIQGACMTPVKFVDALCDRAYILKDVEIVHIHTHGQARYIEPEYSESFHVRTFFLAGNTRKAWKHYTPAFLSDIPNLLRRELKPDVAVIQVTPPDENGYVSYGVSCDVTQAAIATCCVLVAIQNKHAPYLKGTRIPLRSINYIVEDNTPLHTQERAKLTLVDKEIGYYVSTLINDGDTLQLGIGTIPDAVLSSLKHRKNLGVHTEVFSDGLMELMKRGVVNGMCKPINTGLVTCSFISGSQELMDFVHHNDSIDIRPADYTNDVRVISQHSTMVAINSAIEVDLTGQIAGESIGTRQFSGCGGQADFMRGATMSVRGRSIIALPSKTAKGESKIVAMLKPGAVVTTQRSLVDYVVTEYGIAELRGKTLEGRMHELIGIAAPEHRQELVNKALEIGLWG